MSALSEVLDSARFISSSSENVHINQMAVEQVATKVSEQQEVVWCEQ